MISIHHLFTQIFTFIFLNIHLLFIHIKVIYIFYRLYIGFKMSLLVSVDDDLKNSFLRAAKANDMSGSQLIRSFMKDYVLKNKQQDLFQDSSKKTSKKF